MTAETAALGETSDFNGITQTHANRMSAGGELKRSQPPDKLTDLMLKVEAKLHNHHQNLIFFWLLSLVSIFTVPLQSNTTICGSQLDQSYMFHKVLCLNMFSYVYQTNYFKYDDKHALASI